MNNQNSGVTLFSSHNRAISNISIPHSTKQSESSISFTTTFNRPLATDFSEDLGLSSLGKVHSPGGRKVSRAMKTDLNLPELDKNLSLTKFASTSENFNKQPWTPIQRILKLPSKEKLSNLLKMENFPSFTRTATHKRHLKSETEVNLGEQSDIPKEQIWNVFEEKFKLLNYAEERKFFKEDESNIRRTHKNSLEREINQKRLEVERLRLDNMFPDKKIIELKEDRRSKLFLTQMDFYYFSIHVKGRSPPLKLWFKPTDSDRIKVLLSRTTNFPSKFNCEKVFEQTKFIKIKSSEINQNIFTNDYFYFSIVSEVSQFMSLKYSFQDEDVSPKTRKVISRTANDKILALDKMSSETLFKAIKEIQRKRKEKMLEYSKTGDKIQSNKQSAQNFLPEKIELIRKIRKEERQMRMNSVVFNKTVKDQEEFQQKNFSIYKHEISKTLNNIHKLERQMKGKTLFCVSCWRSTVNLINTLIFLNEFFKARYRELQRKRELFFRLKIFVIMFRALLKKKGPTLEKRAFTETKMGLMHHISVKRRSLKDKSAKVLVDILRNNIFNYELDKHGMTFYKKVILLKTKWRDYIQRIRFFKELFKRMWDKYYVFFVIQLADNKLQNVINDPKNLKRISVNILKANDLNSKEFYAQKYFSVRLDTFLKDLKEYRLQYEKQTIEGKKKMKVAELFVSNHIELGSMALLEQGKEDDHATTLQNFEELDKETIKEQLKGIQIQIQQENQKKNTTSLLKYPRLFIPPSVEFIKECVKDVLNASPNKKRLIFF